MTHADLLNDALSILQQLGFPKAQQNPRSVLCLLALLNMTPTKAWTDVEAPLIGITPIMDFVAEHYHVKYQPNTRETFRRQTMHQFVEAGLVLYNPDDPTRPTNSPKAVYQIEPSALSLLQSYGTAQWDTRLQDYLKIRPSLIDRYARKRTMERIPVRIKNNESIELSPGDHSLLIKDIIEEFAPRFVLGAILLYVGDTGDKWAYVDREGLESLQILVDKHGKMPDVLLYQPSRKWLILVEAVTSHGPVNAKRRTELSTLFAKSETGLVYVTAFPTRQIMSRYLSDIAWETEVWVAQDPTHMIHFNGIKFLGPSDQ